jgi:hypothetical protein
MLFPVANTRFRKENLDVTSQNNPNAVFYIFSDQKCKANFLELLSYFFFTSKITKLKCNINFMCLPNSSHVAVEQIKLSYKLCKNFRLRS